jgi:hypothetical protein
MVESLTLVMVESVALIMVESVTLVIVELLTLIMVVYYFEKWSVTEYSLSQHMDIKCIYLVFSYYLKNWYI